jgi:FkbM family methyltransferase
MLPLKLIEGWWLPDDDTYFESWLRKDGDYQRKHREHSLSFVKHFRTAIDVGAHVGFWSKSLADRFNKLYAWEPIQEHRDCWKKNVTAKNATIFFSALSNVQGYSTIKLPGITTANAKLNGISEEKINSTDVTLSTLDSYINLQDIDYIKIDVEGYELKVIEGARQTILKHRPVITLEQKNGSVDYGIERYAAVDYLKEMGMIIGGRVVDDFIMVWDK